MADSFIGEIRLFAGNFAPVNWFICDGRLLTINDYSTLYALIGATYGGDGQTNFALPDLRGRVLMGQGTGIGLTPRTIGENGGSNTVALTTQNMPAHTHTLYATSETGTSNIPTNNYWAVNPLNTYSSDTPNDVMSAAAISIAGQNLEHENRMPSLALNFIICYNGIFPSRN